MKIAFLTAGGLAPCLSSAIAGLTKNYSKHSDIELLAYRNGYEGLLLGDSFDIPKDANYEALFELGGSPIGNSRVKLTNKKDLVKRNLISEDQDPLKVAADRLVADGVSVLHTIGGDDTNTTAADLAAYLQEKNYDLCVVGLPKTIDNDVIPIKQSLGADTAAEQTAIFAKNMTSEYSAAKRSLIVHEVMGRHCGWLTVASAIKYREILDKMEFPKEFGTSRKNWDLHGVYIPEHPFDIQKEAIRLKKVMDEVGNVNIFIAEGAIAESEFEKIGGDLPRDAFGHVQLDKVNPGKWFADQLAPLIDAKKVQVQKPGYFSRSACSNEYDKDLILQSCDKACESALELKSGVVGIEDNYDSKVPDQKNIGTMQLIDFTRIKGAKAYDSNSAEFQKLLKEIGQI